MLDIFICEDNLIQRTRLEQLIQRYSLIEEYDMQLTLSTNDPYELLDYLKSHTKTYGVYFLDVDLASDIDGIQLGAKIRDLCIEGKIIFITTHGELAPLTFKYKVEAMDYILKDQPEELEQRVKEALDQAYKHHNSENKENVQRIRLEVGTQTRFFDLIDIMFIETSPNSHKLILHLANSSVEFYGKITEIEKISEHFLRVHKSFVVNLQNIVDVDRQKRLLTFKNGETCWASTRQITRVNQAFRTK